MKYRLDRDVAFFAFLVNLIFAVLYFVPGMFKVYLSVGHYCVLFAFILSLFSISVIWVCTFRENERDYYIKAVIKTIALIVTFFVAFAVLIVTSGIHGVDWS